MTDDLRAYFYWALMKPVGNRPPRRVTHWHIDPLCGRIPRNAELRGPARIAVDRTADPHFVVCTCFNRAGILGVNVKTVSSGRFGPGREAP